MAHLTLEHAQTIITGALATAAQKGFAPLAVAVLDQRGILKAYGAQDGTSLLRFEIAHGKAYGAIGMGFGSAELARRATERPAFINAINALAGGALVPAPGGVLIRARDGEILGAAGISGDKGHNDELCAVMAIEAAGFVADPG
jgi:uncharacterized protein GlcG (DUF336 family)